MKSKTILITGGTTGIGLATAKLLAADGRRCIVTADEIARLVRLLLSDESSFIVGENLVADGGVRLPEDR